MPDVGATFNLLTNANYPAVDGEVIEADPHNAQMEDLAQGLTDRVQRNGAGSMSGNLNMGTHKLTNLAAGASNGDSVRYEQVQLANAVATAWENLSWANGKIGAATGASSFALFDYTTAGMAALKFVDPNADKLLYFRDSDATWQPVTLAAQFSFSGGTLGLDVDLGTWATITPGTGVATALAVNVGTAGAFVVNGGALGTPASGNLSNCTALPLGSITGLGTGIATFLATPTSANLAAAITDEAGAGSLYFTGGALGTPSSATLTNATGLPVSTGISGLASGIAAWLADPTSAKLATAVTDETGSGALVFGTSPTLTTPNIGTPSAGVLTNCTGLPNASVVGLGTAAVKNTGTSGNNVPLLDGANTWSADHVFSGDVRINGGQLYFGGTTAYINNSASDQLDIVTANSTRVRIDSAGLATFNNGFNVAGGSAQVGGDTIMTRGASETVSGTKTFSASPTISGAGVKLNITSTSAADPGIHITNNSGRLDRILNASGGLYIGVDASGTERALVLPNGASAMTWRGNNVLDTSALGSNVATFLATPSSANLAAALTDETGSGANVFGTSPTLATPTINGGTIQSRVQTSAETSGTLTSASSNKQVDMAGDCTINDGVHTAGDRIEFYAGGSARSIIQDTGMTLRLDGTSTTGTRSLPARGRASVYFVSNSEAIVSGMGVT